MPTIPIEYNLNPHKRGDTIYINVNDVLDAASAAIPLADYTLRAVLKLASDTASNDSSAISVITGGSGITVSSTNDMALIFPASDTDDVTGPTTLRWEVQATLTASPTIVRRTLAYGEIPIMQDLVKTAP